VACGIDDGAPCGIGGTVPCGICDGGAPCGIGGDGATPCIDGVAPCGMGETAPRISDGAPFGIGGDIPCGIDGWPACGWSGGISDGICAALVAMPAKRATSTVPKRDGAITERGMSGLHKVRGKCRIP
jgi:hypothetical protein